MKEHRKRTEILLTVLAIMLVIAGISLVVFLLVTDHYLSFENNWSFILLFYSVIVIPMVFFLLFPALLGEPFFTRSWDEWNDPYEQEIILDIPYQSAFDRCLDSVRLLMRDGGLVWGSSSDRLARARGTDRITPSYPNPNPLFEQMTGGWWSDEGKIVANDRENGIITAESHERMVISFYPLGVPIRSTVTYTLKRHNHSQTQIHIRSTRTPEYGPAYGINRKYVDAVCDFLLCQKP